jgi:hypothetical protein
MKGQLIADTKNLAAFGLSFSLWYNNASLVVGRNTIWPNIDNFWMLTTTNNPTLGLIPWNTSAWMTYVGYGIVQYNMIDAQVIFPSTNCQEGTAFMNQCMGIWWPMMQEAHPGLYDPVSDYKDWYQTVCTDPASNDPAVTLSYD